MFRENYKATIKNILRSPTTLLALGATIILMISLYNGGSSTIGDWPRDLLTLRMNIFNQPRTSCMNLFPAFVGMLVSAHILSEHRNGFSDLLVSSRKTVLSIFLSKLCAVATITLGARIVLLSGKLIWFWGIHYPEAYIQIGVSLPFEKVIAQFIMYGVVYMPFLLLCYTAMPVFVSVITNVPAAGAVWNVAFYLLGFIITPFAKTNLYLPPQSMDDYLSTYIYVDNPEYMKALQAGLYPKALTVYIAWIVFSLALLTAAYFILKKRYRT